MYLQNTQKSPVSTFQFHVWTYLTTELDPVTEYSYKSSYLILLKHQIYFVDKSKEINKLANPKTNP